MNEEPTINPPDLSDELEFCLKATRDPAFYVHDKFPNLYFNEWSWGVMGTCLGFITGLHFSGKPEVAEFYASDLMRVLKQHDGQGIPRVAIHEKVTMPSRVTEMHSDNSLMSFRFLWWGLCSEDDPSEFKKQFGYGLWKAWYRPGINGGIIFRGFNDPSNRYNLDYLQGWTTHT